LQNILREEYKIVRHNLSDEINEFCLLPNIPSQLSQSIDVIRVIGNFAAHPSKDKNTGEIVEVEKGEAEWLIEIIFDLIDFTFIQPSIIKKRKDELNLKLEAMGKTKID
jgi:hypothetical protein